MTPIRHFFVAGLALVLGPPSVVRADVTVTSINQFVHTMVDYQVGGGPIQTDQDAIDRLVLPPISTSVSSFIDTTEIIDPQATAQINNVAYTGPGTIGVAAPGLSFSADFFAQRGGPLLTQGDSTAHIELLFTLDASQAYTFSKVGIPDGSPNPSASLFHVGGAAVPVGSGILTPGNYGFTSFTTGGTHSVSFAITVPEPGTASALAPAAIWILSRRRRQD